MITLKANEAAQLPEYLGSTLRGAMGTALHDRFCIETETDCANCGRCETCGYAMLFRCIRQNGETRRSYPNPFIIYPTDAVENYEKGSRLRFDFTLFGSAVQYYDTYIKAFEEAKNYGLGVYRKSFSLESAVDEADDRFVYYDGAILNKLKKIGLRDEMLKTGRVKLDFDTPLKIRTASHGDTHSADFALIIRGIIRRSQELCHAYSGSFEFDGERIESAIKNCVTERDEMNWHQMQRYSIRMGTKVDISGLTGSMTVAGDLEPLLPVLKLGTIIHAGKACTMGLGHYTMTMF